MEAQKSELWWENEEKRIGPAMTVFGDNRLWIVKEHVDDMLCEFAQKLQIFGASVGAQSDSSKQPKSST